MIVILLSLFVVGIYSVLIPFTLFKGGNKVSETKFVAVYGAIIVGALVVFALGFCVGLQGPQAIDVYRGNTELQVTYKVQGNDTINIDSTVVFNNKKLK